MGFERASKGPDEVGVRLERRVRVTAIGMLLKVTARWGICWATGLGDLNARGGRARVENRAAACPGDVGLGFSGTEAGAAELCHPGPW